MGVCLPFSAFIASIQVNNLATSALVRMIETCLSSNIFAILSPATEITTYKSWDFLDRSWSTFRLFGALLHWFMDLAKSCWYLGTPTRLLTFFRVSQWGHYHLLGSTKWHFFLQFPLPKVKWSRKWKGVVLNNATSPLQQISSEFDWNSNWKTWINLQVQVANINII